VSTDPDKEQLKVVFRNGRIFRREEEKLDVMHFGTYSVRLPLGNMLRSMGYERVSPKELSFARLLEYDANPALMEGQFDTTRQRRVKVEIQKRMALPLACVVLGLFSLPIACVFRALKQQHGLVLAMGVFLVYYALLSIAESMGESRLLPPFVAIWIPNLLFASTGVVFLRHAVRERVPGPVLWVMQRLQSRGGA